MAGYLTDAPDPGTVETDDRCPCCSARDGERCDVDCTCGACENAEPGDPDGESYFRDRAAEYRESQAAAVRLK